MNDIQAEKEYRQTMGLDTVYVTPKERKLIKLSSITNKPIKYWSKLKSKQISAVIKTWK